ncbi:hypothetical protein C8R45DRAFT_1099034 [Mycena sanguinolenta]|nr:hypothetical protein C8R45DRAFT_1099034 [Mycena sanguinolenta]
MASSRLPSSLSLPPHRRRAAPSGPADPVKCPRSTAACACPPATSASPTSGRPTGRPPCLTALCGKQISKTVFVEEGAAEAELEKVREAYFDEGAAISNHRAWIGAAIVLLSSTPHPARLRKTFPQAVPRRTLHHQPQRALLTGLVDFTPINPLKRDSPTSTRPHTCAVARHALVSFWALTNRHTYVYVRAAPFWPRRSPHGFFSLL